MSLSFDQRAALFAAQCSYVLQHLQQHGWTVQQLEGSKYLKLWQCETATQRILIRAQYHGEDGAEVTFELFQRWAAATDLDTFLAVFRARG